MLGFRNLGNTCYMNSVLCVLMNSSTFIRTLQTCEKNDTPTDRQKDAGSLLDSFFQLIELRKEVKEKHFGVIQPAGIMQHLFRYIRHRTNCPLIPYRQNDAMECLSIFLDAFEEATKNPI